MECQIQYVMEATVHQDATVDVKGNVKTTDPIEIDDVTETYVWCDAHQVRLFAGGEHFGVTLNDEWQVLS
jgi:hypothetical protein